MSKEDIIVEIERLVELYNEKPNYGTIDLDMFNEHFNTLIKKIKQDENELKTDSEMIATKESWKNNPLPKENIALDIEKLISTDEMDEIKKGLVPVQMEDKWFVYSDKNKI